mgnify:CR=1 FL=1
MIIYICKFLHLISLFIAGGGGIGSAVIQSIYKKEGKVPEPHLAKGFKVLAINVDTDRSKSEIRSYIKRNSLEMLISIEPNLNSFKKLKA